MAGGGLDTASVLASAAGADRAAGGKYFVSLLKYFKIQKLVETPDF